MDQATYLITFCWFSANDTTVVFINPLMLRPCMFENETVVYLPITNKILLDN